MGRREYIYSYKHDFAFASWLLFGCIGFERNAGLLAPCNVKDLMHGPPRRPTWANMTRVTGACKRFEALVPCNRPYGLFLYALRWPPSPIKNSIFFF